MISLFLHSAFAFNDDKLVKTRAIFELSTLLNTTKYTILQFKTPQKYITITKQSNLIKKMAF